MSSEVLDPSVRAREKQASRDQDAADLASGKKTREQLGIENAFLLAEEVVVRLDLAERLS